MIRLTTLCRSRAWLALALVVVVRILFAAKALLTFDIVRARGGDEPFYLKIAQHLLRFHEYKEGNLLAYRPPLYPAFVAATLALGDEHLWCLQLLQNLLFLGAVILLCAVVHQGWGMRPSLYCAVLLLINPVWLMIPQQVLSETLFVFLIALALFLVSRFVATQNIIWGTLAGLAFGLSALTREMGLYYAFAVFLCLLAKSLTTKTRTLICVVSMFVAVLPWTVRNYQYLHAFVLLDTNGPINLYMGNNPAADGKMHWALPAEAAPLWNQPGTEITVYRQTKAAAIAYVKANPVATLSLLPSKAWTLWGPISIQGIKLNADSAFRLGRTMFWFLLAGLACYGLALNPTHWFKLTIAVWAVVTTVIHLITVAQPIYRSPIEIFLTVPAALALCHLAHWATSRNKSFAILNRRSAAVAVDVI